MRDFLEKMSKEDLIDWSLRHQALYQIEKAEVEWLDELADALREREDEPSSKECLAERKAIKERFNKHIINPNYKL